MATEFVALVAASKEAEWLQNLLLEVPLWPKVMSLLSIHCDSKSILSKIYSHVHSEKSRHIELSHAYAHQLIKGGVIIVIYVQISDNLAYSLKRLSKRHGVENIKGDET